jgi:hypothetical protein
MIPYRALSDAMERTIADPAAEKQAAAAADELIRGAVQSYLDRDYVVRSLLFKKTIENLMENHSANAFTIDASNFSRLPEKWQITPPDSHTVQSMDALPVRGSRRPPGYATDVPGRQVVHLGNMFFRRKILTSITAPWNQDERFHHSNATLGRFVQSGWGTKACGFHTIPKRRHGQDAPERQTGACHERDADSLRRLGQGQLLLVGCRAPPKPGNAEPFVRRQAEYGNHRGPMATMRSRCANLVH